ncbi:MAG: efflux RND transporter periplasmic adaptor subunit [Longimicrobiales bacterium]
MATKGRTRRSVRSGALIAAVVTIGGGLSLWKAASAQDAQAAAADQPEPAEVISDAHVRAYEHREVTTSIGTILATRSVTLRNEVPGTVAEVGLIPGRVVEQGEVLVALDVSVEEAELDALLARAALAETTLARYERMAGRQAVSAIELDNARAERDIAQADIARVRALIARKTIRAPFRARVGLADVHRGQFLEAGSLLTTLQGVDDAVHVDFSVSQSVAAALRPGSVVDVAVGQESTRTVPARVTAIDSRVDPTTRNGMVRARIDGVHDELVPGASVRVNVPFGATQTVAVVPASALRRGPAGDHVYVLGAGNQAELRAYVRPVRAGPMLGRDVVIFDGVRPGERVAAAGSFKLREGVKVVVDRADAPASSVVGEG